MSSSRPNDSDPSKRDDLPSRGDSRSSGKSSTTPGIADSPERAGERLVDQETTQLQGPLSTDPEESWPQLPGFQVLERLGHGLMGVVYRAWQANLKRLVALKIMRGAEGAGAGELARFRTEAEAIARLRHPNIIAIHDIGQHKGTPYLVLEYAEGGSLGQRQAGKVLPLREAAEVVQALARAMHYAHERGVIHRDLKPGNILLVRKETASDTNAAQSLTDPEGAVATRVSLVSATQVSLAAWLPKVSDFSLARLLDEEGNQTKTDAVLGTPSYMAPEQAAGQAREVGAPADIYALGAILYEMLTGRPPFRGSSPQETYHQIRTLEPVPPRRRRPEVPADLEAVCLKCLEKRPADRYPSAEALAEDLDRWLSDQPTRARPWRWSRRLGRLVRRHLLTRSGAAYSLAVVAGLALAAVVALRSRETDRPTPPTDAERRHAYFQAVDERLAAGKPFEFLGKTGKPAEVLWLLNEGMPSATPGRDGAFSYFGPVARSLLEVHPGLKLSGYRFRGEVCHEQDSGGEVGVCVCYRTYVTSGGNVDCYLALSLDDKPHFIPPEDQKRPESRVKLDLWRIGPPDRGIQRASVDSWLFPPSDEPAEKAVPQWYRFVLDVTDQVIRVGVNEEQVREYTPEELGARFQTSLNAPNQPSHLPDLRPDFTPQGGVALNVTLGRAAFRNVAIEPRNKAPNVKGPP